MDVTVHCDDGVSFQVKVSQKRTASNLISQIISIRKASSPIVHLDLQDCVLSLKDKHDETSVHHLESSANLYPLLSKTKVITAVGFRSKIAQDLHRQHNHEFLVEKKSLELNYLSAELKYLKTLEGLNFPLESTSLQLSTCFSADENNNITNISGKNRSDSSNSDKIMDGVSNIGTLLKRNYKAFSNDAKAIFIANNIGLDGPGKTLLASVEGKFYIYLYMLYRETSL